MEVYVVSMTRKQKKILRIGERMFGYSSIERIQKERHELYVEMKKHLDVSNGIMDISQVEFLRLYSKYKTLDKLYMMYMQEEKKHGRKRSDED